MVSRGRSTGGVGAEAGAHGIASKEALPGTTGCGEMGPGFAERV